MVRNRASTGAAALARDERGVVAVMFALLLPVLIGFLGLGAEVSTWYLVRRELQTAADAAAIAAAHELRLGSSVAAAEAEAREQAQANGWNPSDGAITVSSPPGSGSMAGNPLAVEVVLERRMKLLFARLYMQGSGDIRARGVAAVAQAPGTGTACVVGLDASAPYTVHLNNNSGIADPDCGILSNSSSSTGLRFDNNAFSNAPVSVVGKWSLGNNAALKASANLQGATPIADPYASVSLPAAGSCTGQTAAYSHKGTYSLSPGRFCSGWNFKNNATINLAPGVYFVESALSIGNGATINGTGVTIVVKGGYAIDLGNNGVLNVSAPSSGATAGIAIMNDRTGSASTVQVFPNNTQLNLRGAVYFPNQSISLENNAFTGSTGCSQLVGRKVVLMNNAKVGNDCGGVAVKPVTMPKLVVRMSE